MHRFRLREHIARWEADNRSRLRLKDLAARTGIAPQTLTKIADPKGYVTNTRYVEALCRFFQISPSELIELVPPIPDQLKNRETLVGDRQSSAKSKE